MRKSIFRQLMLLFLIFSLMIHGIGFLFINYGLPKYYVESEKDRLHALAEGIFHNFESDKWTDPLVNDLIREIKGNFYVFSEDKELLFSSLYSEMMRGRGMMGMGNMALRLPQQFRWPDERRPEILLEYSDSRNFNWILYTLTDGERTVVFQVSSTNIETPIAVFEDFYLWLFIISSFIGIGLAIVFAKGFTRPIRSLEEVARAMENLQFDLRYEEDRSDELGSLGRSLNRLAGTLKVTIDQLKRELEKEKRIDRLRKDLIAQVSHELQTPIAILKGYVEMLEDGMVEGEEEKTITYQRMQREMNAMSHLIGQMLQLSTYESNAVKLKKEMIHFDNYVQKSANRFLPVVAEKNIQMDLRLTSKAEVEIDPLRFTHVLTNLITNAIEHTPPGGQIQISSEKIENQVLLRVFNEGEWVDEKDLSRIFESFYQKRGKETGTGLGLSIVKQIVRLHDGFVQAENEKKGVAFSVYLKAE